MNKLKMKKTKTKTQNENLFQKTIPKSEED